MAKIDTREIQIPSILKVEKDLLRRIGGYLADEGIYKVVILFGNGLIDMFGHTVMEGMSDSGVEVLQYMEMDTVRIDDLVQLAFHSRIQHRQCLVSEAVRWLMRPNIVAS